VYELFRVNQHPKNLNGWLAGIGVSDELKKWIGIVDGVFEVRIDLVGLI